MHRLLLFLVYFLVVTPIGLVSRIIHDPLRRCLDRRARSYWIFTACPPEG
jgi:hypothetical protein